MKTYETQSLYEASFLLSEGFQLISKNSSGHKITLSFEDSTELKNAIMCFYNGQGRACAKALFDSYRSLKDMVFQR